LWRNLSRSFPGYFRFGYVLVLFWSAGQLQSLVRLARNEAHEKADMYAAALDEVRSRADQLDKESLQRLLVGLLGILFGPR